MQLQKILFSIAYCMSMWSVPHVIGGHFQRSPLQVTKTGKLLFNFRSIRLFLLIERFRFDFHYLYDDNYLSFSQSDVLDLPS